MSYSIKLRKMRGEKIDAAKAIMAKSDAENRVMSADENKAYDTLVADAAAIRSQIEKADQQAALEKDLEAVQTAVLEVPKDHKDVNSGNVDLYAEFMVPPKAQPKLYGSVRHAPDMKFAYRFGMFMGFILGAPWCRGKNQQRAKDMFGADNLRFDPNAILTEGTNTAGGYLVIEEFLNNMVLLIEKYGVFRRNSKIVPMGSDQVAIPRRTAGLTAYPVGEGSTGTESTKTWDRIQLVAKKWMALTRMSSELQEDAVINIGDDLLFECAYAMAIAEDNAGFIGDGTSTYAGITGLKNALTSSAKWTQLSSNTWNTITTADLEGVKSIQPDFTVAQRNKWYVNKAFFYQVMRRLEAAGGGNTTLTLQEGVSAQRYMGDDVEFVSAMPFVTATSGIMAYYGDLAAASKFGDRREFRIAMSQEASVGGQSMWERDEVGIKATERFDIVVHERGSGTAGKGGPINAHITS